MKTKGYLYVILTFTSGGIFPFIYKNLVTQIQLYNAVFILFLFSFLYNFLYSLFAVLTSQQFIYQDLKKFSKANKKVYFFFIALGFVGFIGNSIAGLSYHYLSPAVIQVVQRTEVFNIIVFGAIFLKEGFRVANLLSFLIILLGIMTMEYSNLFSKNSNYHESIFILLPFFTAFFFSLITILGKILVNKNYSAVFINGVRSFITLLIIILIPGVIDNLTNIKLNVWFWGALSAFIGPFISRIFYTQATKVLPVGDVSIFVCSSVVVTVILHIIFLEEKILLEQIIGGSILMLGILITLIDQKFKK